MKTHMKFLSLPILLLALTYGSAFAGHIEPMEDQSSDNVKIPDQIQEQTVAEILRKTDLKVLEKAINQTMCRVYPGQVALKMSIASLTSFVVLSLILFILDGDHKPMDSIRGAAFFILPASVLITSLTYGMLKISERNEIKKVAANFAKMLKEIAEKEKTLPNNSFLKITKKALM